MDQWNDQLVPIVQHMSRMSQLPNAPKVLNRPVVVLSNVAKARVAALIEEGLAVAGPRKLNVLVRQGDPRNAADLTKVCVEQADKVCVCAHKDTCLHVYVRTYIYVSTYVCLLHGEVRVLSFAQ